MKQSLVAIALLVSCSSAFGQKKIDSIVEKFGTFSMGFAYNTQQFNSLNQRIAANANLYQALPNYTPSLVLAFGSYQTNSKIISHTDFGFGSSLTGNRNKRSTNLTLVNGSFTVGYNLSNNKKIMAYPYAGLQVSYFRAGLFKDNSAVNFSDVLSNPSVQQSTTPLFISNTFWGYRAGFAVDFINKKNKKQGWGLFAAYNGSFNNRAWRINENQLTNNAPTDGLSQFSFGIKLNGYSYVK